MKCLTIITLFLCLQTAGSFAQSHPVTVISGATLIDGTGRPPVSDAIVIIEGDKITKVGTPSSITIPQGAHIINALAKFVLPGLIDTHVHLESVGLSDIGELPPDWNTPAKLQELAALNAKLDLLAGFTTVRDLGSTNIVFKVRNEINSGKLLGPRVVAAGMQLVKKSADAHSEPMFLAYDGLDDARAKVRYLVRIGADVIKIRLTHTRPIPSLQEVQAIVEEAHQLGLRATVHTDVPAEDLVKLAIDAGADGIEHNAPLRSQDEQTLIRMSQRHMSLMAGAGAFYVQRIDSTGFIDVVDQAQTQLLPQVLVSALHTGIDSLHEQTNQMKKAGWDASQRLSRFLQETQRARKARVLLVFGTDCGAYGMIHGEQYKALYGESKMGSSAMETILMATRDAAVALGKANEIGTVEPGKLADLIVVDANPLEDLRNLQQIFRVIKAGSVYDPAELISRSKR